MMEKEKEQLLQDIEAKVKEVIVDSQKEFVKESDIQKRLDAINKQIADGLDDDGRKELKGLVDKLAQSNETLAEANKNMMAELKAMKEGRLAGDAKPKSFRDLMRDAIMEKGDIVLTKKNDDYGERYSLKEWFTDKGNSQTPTFVMKDAVDMLQSDISRNYVDYIRLTQLDPNRVGIPLTIYPHVLDVMPSKRISKPYMSLLVVYTYTDGSGTKTEGSVPSKSSFLFKTVSFKAFYVATYFTLSDETLDDLEEALDEINTVAPDKIKDSIDGKVLGISGDDSSDIGGMFSASVDKHTDFASATYANFAEGANVIDLIAAAKLQCETNKYHPNETWMNPLDVAKLAALKDAMDNSVADRRITFDAIGNPLSVCGLIIRNSSSITANTLVVDDRNQLMLGVRKDMTIEIGYNGTDLTEGQKTVMIKVRVAFGVRDQAAVIYSSDIDSDIASITKSGA
jgi:hypothetical protein